MLLFIYLNELVNKCICNRFFFLEQNSMHKYVNNSFQENHSHQSNG
jgi:hypothetical protein